MSLSTTRWKRCYVICLTKPVVFIPDARPVFCVKCVTRHPVFKALCTTLRYEDIAMLLLCMLCVVLWMCYECVMNVLWMCYECVMNVLWMCCGCVMDVLWMRYGCVMDLLWMCEDVCVVDEWWTVLYVLCKLYCKWCCNCDIVVVLWYKCYANFVFCFSGLFTNDQ